MTGPRPSSDRRTGRRFICTMRARMSRQAPLETVIPSIAARPAAPRVGRGYAAALAAFGIWGLFPLYLIGLRHVSAEQITAHRIVWSCLFCLGWLAVTGELGKLRAAAARKGVFVRLVASA